MFILPTRVIRPLILALLFQTRQICCKFPSPTQCGLQPWEGRLTHAQTVHGRLARASSVGVLLPSRILGGQGALIQDPSWWHIPLMLLWWDLKHAFTSSRCLYPSPCHQNVYHAPHPRFRLHQPHTTTPRPWRVVHDFARTWGCRDGIRAPQRGTA